jgi:hypothetical protein
MYIYIYTYMIHMCMFTYTCNSYHDSNINCIALKKNGKNKKKCHKKAIVTISYVGELFALIDTRI